MPYEFEIAFKEATYRFPASIQPIKKSQKTKVFDNRHYTIKLFEDENEVADCQIYINGEAVDTDIQNTFEGYYGWIKISAKTAAATISTGFIEVVTTDAAVSQQIHKMIQYIVYRLNRIEFPGNVNDLLGISTGGENKNFKTEDLLNRILKEYEENFRHFYNNSRATLSKASSVESIEKLKGFSQDTARFIVSNPQYLAEVKQGPVKFNKRFFSPLKTLVSSNRKNLDIYENRVVLGFLKHIIDWREGSESMLSFKDFFHLANEGKELVFVEYSELQEKFRLMYQRYKSIFGDIKDVNVDSLPPLTHIFKSVNHYRSIYRYMRLFFAGGIISPTDEDAVRWYLDTSSKIYEYYVFLQLDEAIVNSGYTRNPIKKPSGNNLFPEYFYYEKGKEKKYLYFQPEIIFDGYGDDKGIHLRRNTEVTLSGGNSKSPYTPDYIIKDVDANNNEFYEIADAKFSDFSTVQDVYRPKAAFKYLVSVYALNGAKISGLKLYYCKGNDKNRVPETLQNPYIRITPLKEEL